MSKLYSIWLFAVMLIGFALHVALRGNVSARNQNTPWNSFKQFFLVHWVAIVIRGLIHLFLFSFWVNHSTIFADTVRAISHSWKLSDVLVSLASLSSFSAFAYGLSFDLVMEYGIGWLKRRFPDQLSWLDRELPEIKSSGNTVFMTSEEIEKLKQRDKD